MEVEEDVARLPPLPSHGGEEALSLWLLGAREGPFLRLGVVEEGG